MSTALGMKRKALEVEETEREPKRAKPTIASSTPASKEPHNAAAGNAETAVNGHDAQLEPAESEKKKGKRRATDEEAKQDPPSKLSYRKLAPPRPFPTVPTSVSATGPRSAHVEGKNYICITRKTPLGAYLRRCKDVILKDGHKTLHLNAMGAAIPHLMQLAVSLPNILPYAPEEVHTEVLTGTAEVQDEVIPEDEDEDISYRTRGKSTVSVVVRIGDGVDEGARTGKGMRKTNKRAAQAAGGSYDRGKGQKPQWTQGVKDNNKQPVTSRDETDTVVIRVEDLEDD